MCKPFEKPVNHGQFMNEIQKKIPIQDLNFKIKKRLPIPKLNLDKAGGNAVKQGRNGRQHIRDSLRYIKASSSSLNKQVIEDDFPVWLITLLVSCFVTAAMAIILYFY